MSKPLRLYGSASCPQCQALKKYLTQKQIPFEYFDVFKDPSNFDELDKRGLTTLPVTMSNDGTSYVTGFDIKSISKLIKEEE